MDSSRLQQDRTQPAPGSQVVSVSVPTRFLVEQFPEQLVEKSYSFRIPSNIKNTRRYVEAAVRLFSSDKMTTAEYDGYFVEQIMDQLQNGALDIPIHVFREEFAYSKLVDRTPLNLSGSQLRECRQSKTLVSSPKNNIFELTRQKRADALFQQLQRHGVVPAWSVF